MAQNPTVTNLDQQQILQRTFDKDNDRLRVDAELVSPILDVSIDASTDNIAIKDPVSENILAINPNGSINVMVTNCGAVACEVKSYFHEITNVLSSVLTTISTLTIPIGKTAKFERVSVAGTNSAIFEIYVNNVIFDRKYTSTFQFNEDFDFVDSKNNGIPLNAGDIIEIKVVHYKSSLGDFNARIQYLEIG